MNKSPYIVTLPSEFMRENLDWLSTECVKRDIDNLIKFIGIGNIEKTAHNQYREWFTNYFIEYVNLIEESHHHIPYLPDMTNLHDFYVNNPEKPWWIGDRLYHDSVKIQLIKHEPKTYWPVFREYFTNYEYVMPKCRNNDFDEWHPSPLVPKTDEKFYTLGVFTIQPKSPLHLIYTMPTKEVLDYPINQ